MRHRLTLERKTRVADDGGGASESWTAVATVWAELRESTGSERVEAFAVTGVRQVIAVIRFRAGLYPDMRAVVDGTVFNIRAVRDGDGRARFLELVLESGVAT